MQCKAIIEIRSQRGVVTLAVGILLLVLITLVTLYGARVGLMEQRISSNDYRSKLVHGAAEAGRNQAVEFLNANLPAFNTEEDPVILADGTQVTGWLASGNDRWGDGVAVDCDPDDNGDITKTEKDEYSAEEQIACQVGLDADGAQGVYFYNNTRTLDVFPTAKGNLLDERVGMNSGKTGEELRVSFNADLVLCPLNTVEVDHDNDEPTAANPTPRVPRIPKAPGPVCANDIEGSRYFAVLVRSEGYLVNEAGERLSDQVMAERSEVVVKYDLFGAGPALPLTVTNTFGSGGTFDIVANPNGGPNAIGGGRSGAPFSVWSEDTYTFAGATVTCQRNEFFATAPGDNYLAGDRGVYTNTPSSAVYEICDDCTCPDKQNEQFYYLSSDVKGPGIDIVHEDPNFPDDLFLFTFGVPREEYTILKELAKKIPGDVASCGDLTTASSGLYWVEGTSCTINEDVGSPHSPLLVISEGDFSIQGGSRFFGVVYLFSPPDTTAAPDLDMQGGSQIYGAVVGDSDGQGSGSGGNVIVYDEAVINRVSLSPEIQRVSPFPGTWSDRTAP